MMPRPRLVRQLTSSSSQQVGEECERGEDCYQGRDQAQAPNEITDRPVKPSSAGIPLSALSSDTVVCDREDIGQHLPGGGSQERKRGERGGARMVDELSWEVSQAGTKPLVLCCPSSPLQCPLIFVFINKNSSGRRAGLTILTISQVTMRL